MARPAASEEARIARLRAALDRAVSQGLVAESFNAKQMYELLQVNRSTFREWTSEPEIAASGAFVAGAEGVDYAFNPIATIWVLIRWFERKRDARMKEHLRIREAVAGDSLDSAPAEMSMRDVREAMGLHLQLLESERLAGDLVSRSEADAQFRSLTLALREAMLSAPQKLDPTNEWAPEFREKFDNVLADLMVQLRQAGQEALSLDDGPVPAGPSGEGPSAPKRKAPRAPRRTGAKRTGSAATA